MPSELTPVLSSLGSSPTEKVGMTAVFLDPPYGDERDLRLYAVDDTKYI
ncbi:hypothetical protein LCGC14_2680170 [marine sediment metagenome]|uniref:Uncharacterized protein n=1 Tax=marine sediment metagenome TaxID=412755 RepID=A0A0F9BWA8_9ZZZZ